jgi:hypothetical protein
LFCRRDLELHWPFGARIRIASPLFVVRGRATRFRHITIRIRQIFPADAGLGPRRALSFSSSAALCAFHVGSSALITIVRCRLLNSRPESYPSLKYAKTASTDHDADDVEEVGRARPASPLAFALVVTDPPAHRT